MNITPMWAAIFTFLGVTLFYTLVGLLAFLMNFFRLRKNPINIIIRDTTQGKPMTRNEIGRIIDHRKYGPFMYIPRTKEILPRFEDYFFYPTNKANRKSILVTNMDGLPTANEIQKKDNIKGAIEAIKANPVAYENINYFETPVKMNMRQFAFMQKDIINEKTKIEKSFWEKHGALLVSGGMIAMVGVVCIVTLIFTIDYSGSILETARGAGLNEAEIANKVMGLVENAPKG